MEGLNSKVKLGLYKAFSKEVEFKRYLHGVSDAGTRLLFKFRSGTHGLNEEFIHNKLCYYCSLCNIRGYLNTWKSIVR